MKTTSSLLIGDIGKKALALRGLVVLQRGPLTRSGIL